MSDKKGSKLGLGIAIGAVAGAAVGAVAGVLTAPKSGKETREDLKKQATNMKEAAGKKFNEVKNNVSKKIRGGKSEKK